MTTSVYNSYFKEMDTYLDLRDLAINTRKNYHSSLKAYLTWLSETLAVSPEDAIYDNIRTYLLHLKHNRKLSNHSINAHASTIRFFRIYILKQGWSQVEVPRMKYRIKLPFVLSKEEVLAFIDSIPNLKHKAFIVLLYSSGLRISEVCSLRYEDVQRKNLRIFIRSTKNRSERYAVLSTSALEILTDYWKTHGKPLGWLFPGRNPDSHIVKDTGSRYIQNIFSQAYDHYRGSAPVRPAAHKAAVSIIRCKTALLGGNSAVCQDCGAAEVHYNSCRNRHCPCCQAVNKEKWIDARKADVVDAPYFHAVFTVPEQLNSLFLANRRLLFSLLYDSSAATLKELAGDKRHLGAQIGFISILHTWGSNLSFHPHIHAIALGGGLSRDQEFIASKTGFLFPVRAVSKLFRGKFLHGLKSLYQSGQLNIPFSQAMLRYPSQFNDFLSVLYAKEWIPHLKETFKGAANVIEYLGRYTHNIAISNSMTDQSVTFRIKDYRTGNPSTLTLSLEEFIRRFLMHVLPDRFVRIRHYGLLSNRSKRQKMALVRQLVGGVRMEPRFRDMTTLQMLKKLYNFDPGICRHCGGKHLINRTLPSIPKLE